MTRSNGVATKNVMFGQTEAGEGRLEGPLRGRSARVMSLVAITMTLTYLVEAGIAPLLAWTRPLIPQHKMPWLFVLLLATYVAMAIWESRRQSILLAASIAAMLVFSPLFGGIALAYLLLFHRVVESKMPHLWKLSFLGVTYLGLAVLANMALFPRFIASNQWVLLFAYMFATNFTFRLFYVLHDAKQRPKAERPRQTFLLYFLLLPFFIVVPYMLAIPRYDRFAKSLAAPRWQTEVAGIERLAVGLVFVVGIALARRVVDVDVLLISAAREGHWWRCIALAPLAYPVWAVFKVMGTAYILVGMINVLGIELGPAFDAPLRSTSVVDWWRRWNIHFREFLVDVFFYPLMMRYRRKNPYLVIAMGCASVFLVGSTLFHWIAKHLVSRASHHEIYWSILAENLFFFVLVTLALCVERRALGKTSSPKAPPHRSFLRVGARRLVTYYAIFIGVAGLGYTTQYLTVMRPFEQQRDAIELAREHADAGHTSLARSQATALIPRARTLVLRRPTDVERRVALAHLLSLSGVAPREVRAELAIAASLLGGPLLDANATSLARAREQYGAVLEHLAQREPKE